jgi:outer membrane receptor for ferrienterochelin and colicins
VAFALALALGLGSGVTAGAGGQPGATDVPTTSSSDVTLSSPDAGVSADAAAPDDPGEVIVITGTRSEHPLDEAPILVEVVRREQIEASGAETAAQALAQRPGLWLERGIGGTRVTMQGLGPEYVLILVDGQRQIGRVDGTLDLDRLGVGDLEQIEVVRGPSSALYGADAIGGVINLITRDPTEPEAALSARHDSRGASGARGRVAGAAGSWFGAASGEWRDAPAFDRTPDEPSTTISAYRDLRASGRAGHRRGEGLRLELAADYLRRDLEGVDALASGAIFDRRNRSEVAGGRATARARLSDTTTLRGSLGAGLYRDQFVNDQRGSAALDEDQDTREGLLESAVQLDSAIADGHYAIAGIEAQRETISSPRLATGDAERWRIAGFGQDEWWLGEDRQIVLVPAARVDHDSQFGTHATPRLAARWALASDLAARASVGLGFRAPGFRELYLQFENPGAGYVVEGNPGLGPETSESVQLGAEWQAHRVLWLALHGFWNEIDDLISAVSDNDGSAGGPRRFSYANIGHARTRGVETMVALRRGRFAAEIGWAFTRADNLDAGRPLEGVPRQRLTAALRFADRRRGVDGSVEGSVTGPRPYFTGDDEASRTYSEPRLEVRARAAKTFAWLTTFVGVDNLLDVGDDAFDPLAPRTFYGGVSAHY